MEGQRAVFDFSAEAVWKFDRFSIWLGGNFEDAFAMEEVEGETVLNGGEPKDAAAKSEWELQQFANVDVIAAMTVHEGFGRLRGPEFVFGAGDLGEVCESLGDIGIEALFDKRQQFATDAVAGKGSVGIGRVFAPGL